MKIGLLSDTHGYLDPKIKSYLDQCDELWHAGDIGNSLVVKELEMLAPVVAVFGNIDGSDLRTYFKEDLVLERAGFKILLTHIGGNPPRYNPRARKIIGRVKPDIFVCGHSHILKIWSDPNTGMLYLNPGAAGRHGFHKIRTLIRFDLNDRKVSNMQVVELGQRSALS